MCIETGLRILNGKYATNMANNFTYCGASVIDYVLSTLDIFSFIFKFICNVNGYSDHAPLHIELRTGINFTLNQSERTSFSRHFHVRYRWKEDLENDSAAKNE